MNDAGKTCASLYTEPIRELVAIGAAIAANCACRRKVIMPNIILRMFINSQKGNLYANKGEGSFSLHW